MFFFQAVLLFSTPLCGWAFELPGLLQREKRQDIEPGSPLYDCHASCGYAIEISQSADYCSNSTFTSDLSSCLECALTYDIWQYYGSDVSNAATACGDDATPSSSSATAGASATAASTGTVATASSATASTTAVQTSGSQTSATATASGTSSTSTPQSAGAILSLSNDSKWALLAAIGALGIFQAYM